MERLKYMHKVAFGLLDVDHKEDLLLQKQMDKCKPLIILLLLLLPGFSQAQVLSLDSILKHINQHNPMLNQYNDRSNALKAYAEGSKAWMAPMAGGGLWMTPYPGQEVMEMDKGMAMISVEQEIPNPAKLKANQDYLNSKVAIEEAARAKDFNELRAQAKQLYYQWLTLDKKMSLLKESEEIIQLMIKLEKIRYPYGQGKLGNIYKAEGKLYEVQNMSLMTGAQMKQKNILLNTLMHLPVTTEYKIDTSVKEYHLPLIETDTTYLTSTRSDIRQIDHTINSMRYNLKLENVQRKPNFKIRFDHMQSSVADNPKLFTVMGMISIPIAPWSSKMYKSNIKGMNHEIKAMAQERENIISEAQGMISIMAVEINSKKLQLDNYRNKILPAFKKNYDTELLAYQENQAQLPSVISAWENLNMAQIQYLDNLEEWLLMIVSYEKELEK